MSNITLIGAHGRVALHLIPILHGRGERVVGVIRNPAHADEVARAGATPLVADVERLSVAELSQLLSGQDAVVWSAGAGGGNPARTYAVDRDAAIRTIDAAGRAGVARFVMVSYMGAGPDHGVAESNPFFPYAQAKTAADAHLSASGLDWTILRPGLLTEEEATGAIAVVDGPPFANHPTSRANVALAIAAALQDRGTVGRAIEFGDGPTPIATALAR